MSVIMPKTVNFGSSKGGLATVGLTLLNADNSEHTARAITGVYEIGTATGCYGKNVTFDDDWKGSLKWDTGGASPVYAVEEYSPTDGKVAGLNDITVAEIIAGVADGSYDLQEMLRGIFSVICLETGGGGTPLIYTRNSEDNKNRITASVDVDGNRTSVILDLT